MAKTSITSRLPFATIRARTISRLAAMLCLAGAAVSGATYGDCYYFDIVIFGDVAGCLDCAAGVFNDCNTLAANKFNQKEMEADNAYYACSNEWYRYGTKWQQCVTSRNCADYTDPNERDQCYDQAYAYCDTEGYRQRNSIDYGTCYWEQNYAHTNNTLTKLGEESVCYNNYTASDGYLICYM